MFYNSIPKKGFFGWNDVGCGMLVCLIILGIIMHTIIFGDKKYSIHSFIIDTLDKCIIKCTKPACLKYTSLRDPGYMNSSQKINDDKKCVFMGWELSHLIFHMFLGYYYNIYISMGISVGYEILERVLYNCASYADLGINFTGFLVGAYFR